MVRERLATALRGVEERVLFMGEHAKGMLHDSLQSLADLDAELAEAVAARCELLADLDEDIEHSILQLMALQTPVASDLRRLGAAMKLITYLNRIGRYGFDIAKVVKAWPEGKGHIANTVGIKEMGKKVEQMLNIALEAFASSEVPAVDAVRALEEDVDAMRAMIFRECLTYMMEDSQAIERGTQYVMVARYLERCGDNICKMVEKLHYAATGERLLLH